MKTYSAKPTEVVRKWYVVDASENNLGRVATQVAKLLMGKDKPSYTRHIDVGDFVVVINAGNIQVTGGKETKKIYYKHSDFPGGLRATQLKDMDQLKVIHKAVYGMLPVNKLRDERLKRLKVYLGNEHNHAAQSPVNYSVKDNK
jgi:large subunit ribosomal protein L13